MRKYLLQLLTVFCYCTFMQSCNWENTDRSTTNDRESPELTRPSKKCDRPLKGRPFQELVNLSDKWNSILFNTQLSPKQRTQILITQGVPITHAALLKMAEWVDRSEKQQCDAPCFAAIQDSIILSATDETLDVFWYYEQDSVLMFDMGNYKQIIEKVNSYL